MARQVQNLIVLLFLVIAFTSVVSALAFPQNSTADIRHLVTLDNGIVNGTVCQLSVKYPNNTILVDYELMTEQKNFHNFTLNNSQTKIKGTYNYDVICSFPSGANVSESFSYIVTLSGIEPSQQRTDALSRTIYFVLGMGVLLFIAFAFTEKLPFKLSLILLALLFFLIGTNLIFLTLQDEVINPKLENFFEAFTVFSFISYRFIAFLIGSIWLITFFVTLFTGMKERKQRRNEF